MKNFQSYLFFSLFSVLNAFQVTYPLENEVLNSFCLRSDGSKGTLKLLKDCQFPGDEELAGFIKFVGAVVCCPKKSKINAKSFCTKHGAEFPSRLDFHIAAGEEANVEEFPHMAALGYETFDREISFDCGGSLISEKFVITAAHCCNLKGKKPVTARLGRTSLDLNNKDDSSFVYDAKIKHIIIPKEYSAINRYDDIALLEFENPVIFTENIKPICLETDNDVNEHDRNFTVIGFGIKDVDTRIKSNWLMKTTVKELSIRNCNDRYKPLNVSGLNEGVKKSQVCASGERNLRGVAGDSCPGDSGSPLQIKSDLDHKYRLVGLTSFGLGCGSTFPSVYSRVSSRISWIEQNVWP